MEDRELDRALADAAGIRYVVEAPKVMGYANGNRPILSDEHYWLATEDGTPVQGMLHPGRYSKISLPTYSTSIDALPAVEAKLRAAGWWLTIAPPAGADGKPAEGVVAEWSRDSGKRGGGQVWLESHHARATTEARARAEAALLALRAIEPTSITTLASRGTGS